MLDPSQFLNYLETLNVGFVTGVPDSLLKSFCEEVYSRYGVNSKQHIVAVNEGNAVALAAGYHLATKKLSLVYLQNSGLGNAVNPAASLTDPAVYRIPVIYLVGWRGEPGVHDEPQHVKQGEITEQLLDVMGIEHMVVDKETTLEEVMIKFSEEFSPALARGKSVALVVRKGAIQKGKVSFARHDEELSREEALGLFAEAMGEHDFAVSTTGKISRELFEYCKRYKSGNSSHNFLTVGSMGHASAIALSVALQEPKKTIWCLDGDGATLMHLGSLATIGTMKPENFIHVVLNNEAHESVGGMPTVAGKVDLEAIAKGCCYPTALTIRTKSELEALLASGLETLAKPILIQVFVSTGSREDLMRPNTTPTQNKEAFMGALGV